MVPSPLVLMLQDMRVPALCARSDAADVVAAVGEALVYLEKAWASADELRTERLGTPVTLATRLQRPMDKGTCMCCGQVRSVLFVVREPRAPAATTLYRRAAGTWVALVPESVASASDTGREGLSQVAQRRAHQVGVAACHACCIPVLCEVVGQNTPLGAERRGQRIGKH